MTMSETTQSKATRQPRKKPERFAKLTHYGEDVVLTMRQVLSGKREQTDTYTLEPIPSDYGRGFLLHKPEGTSYAVLLSGPDSTCECKGFESHGHCKHCESLLA